MSARLETLLDLQRLSDCIQNDVLMGIEPPPVEQDEAFFNRIDMAYARDKDSGALDRRNVERIAERERLMDRIRTGAPL